MLPANLRHDLRSAYYKPILRVAVALTKLEKVGFVFMPQQTRGKILKLGMRWKSYKSRIEIDLFRLDQSIIYIKDIQIGLLRITPKSITLFSEIDWLPSLTIK